MFDLDLEGLEDFEKVEKDEATPAIGNILSGAIQAKMNDLVWLEYWLHGKLLSVFKPKV